MNSIVSYKDRGTYGDSSYRGNCTGNIIKDIIMQFYPNSKPKKFIEIFSGGGTGKDVAKELGINNSLHLDLINGWDALVNEIPSGSDLIFSHPPYWDIIKYQYQRNSYNANDLSNPISYEEFIKKLNKVNAKIYCSLVRGGRHAILIGDVRKQGRYYSIIKDMNWYGELESHIIKVQHNCVSDNRVYSGNFIPIKHEHLLIFKKREIWIVNIKQSTEIRANILYSNTATWRDIIQAAIESVNGKATTEQLYKILKDSKKAKNNNFVREKIRQTLNTNKNFKKSNNEWILCIE